MKRKTVATAFVLALTLLLAPAAQARYDQLGSGQTKLTLDPSFLALMKQSGVKVSAVAPAKLKGTTVSFPVASGKFDPTTRKGTVEHDGALLFQAGAKKIPLKSWQLKTTQKGAPFSVKAGGGQLKLASAKSLTVKREGFGDAVWVTGLALTQKLATRLGKKLGLRDVFKAGVPFGSTSTTANPKELTVLDQGKVTLSLDPGFEAKLKSLFVALNPVFPAEHPGPFTLAILGGTIAPDAASGTVQTQGGLEFLQLGGGQVTLSEAWLELASSSLSAEADTQPSPPFAGRTERAPVAALGAAQHSANAKARTVTVTNAALTMSIAMAQSFNDVFAKPQGKDGVFAAGEAVGSVGFVAATQ